MSIMSTTIQIRVDKAVKQKADKTFKKMGLDMSSGVKLFLHRVIQSGSIPFTLRTANGFTPAQERQILRDSMEASVHGKTYKTVKEMFDDILKD